MREILFRGKRIDNGEWIEGYLVVREYPKTHYIVVSTLGTDKSAINNMIATAYEVDPETVGQYTGLPDKNGKKIFEGDICRFREWSKGEMCWVGKVHWEHQQFIIAGGPNKECETMFELRMSRFIPEDIEIIGNIHDNPELLEANHE